MFRLNRYLALMALPYVGCSVQAIVIRHTGSTSEAVALASGDFGIYKDLVGRVYYSGNQRSTTPAAIIHEDRALVFAKEPRKIESIELNDTKYKVIGIKEIIKEGEGTLVCCTIEEKFSLGIDLKHNILLEHCVFSINSKTQEGEGKSDDLPPFCHPYKTDRYKHGLVVHKYEKCSTASLVGFGVNYYMDKYTTEFGAPERRAEVIIEGYEKDALKAVDACVYQCLYPWASKKYLWCPFDDVGITFTDERGTCWDEEGKGWYDGKIYNSYIDTIDRKDPRRFINDGDSRIPPKHRVPKAEHQKNQGYVGPDDLGAFLVNVNEVDVTITDPEDRNMTKTITVGQQNLLGFACKAGSQDITDPKKPFYPRVSTFLRLSSINWTHGLWQISTVNIPKGYTTVEGRTTPISQDIASSKLKEMLNNHGYPIRNHHILIDPFVGISTSPRSRKSIIIREKEYSVEKIEKLGAFNLVYYSKPILEVNPIPIFHGVDAWKFIQEQNMRLASPGSFFTIEEPISDKQGIPRYVVGFTDSSEIQFTQSDRTKIDSAVIADALGIAF